MRAQSNEPGSAEHPSENAALALTVIRWCVATALIGTAAWLIVTSAAEWLGGMFLQR